MTQAGADGPYVLVVQGDVDMDRTFGIRTQLEEALGDCSSVIQLDLSGASFLDCAGLSTLLWCVRRGRRDGVSVELKRPSPPVTRVLAATRTRSCFPLAS